MKLGNLISKKESKHVAKQTNVQSGGVNFTNGKSESDNQDIKIKNYVLISKGTGKFYNVYEDDAFIISFIMDYKVLPGIKCGFPDNVLSKVIKNLDDNHISYKVVVNNTVTDEYNYKNLNQYDKYVILSRKTAMLNDRLDLLIKEIKKADRATLEKIIEYIEKCLRL